MGDWLTTPPSKNRELLLNLSGGVDSAFATWRLLDDGYRLLLHHARLVNREGRADAEHRAVLEITDWLRDKGLTRFTLVTSGYDQGTLGRMPYDVEVIGFLTGVIMRDVHRRNIDTVVVTSNRDDVSVTDPDSPRVVRRRKLAHLMAARPLKWWIAFGHLSKQEMAGQMPSELIEACWWCRFPRGDGGQVCGRCRPCREMQTLRFEPAKESS